MDPAAIVHLARPLALGDLLTQIRQPDIGAVLLGQCLLAVLPGPPAFLAAKADQFAGVFVERERAIHGDQNRPASMARNRIGGPPPVSRPLAYQPALARLMLSL